MHKLAVPLMLALLAGCASKDVTWSHVPSTEEIIAASEARKSFLPAEVKVGKPYTVSGITYYPAYQPDYVAEGIASWYGPGFHGNSTASGERYNKMDFTAAHPTLPLPSLARVTNLDNGRQITVRINDRGPFARGRILDLSHSSAKALGVIGPGTARVRVEYLDKETRHLWTRLALGKQPAARDEFAIASMAPQAGPLPTVIEPGPITTPTLEPSLPILMSRPAAVQVGSFVNRHNAEQAAYKLASLGAIDVEEVQVNGRTFWRVKLRPDSGASVSLEDLQRHAQSEGYKDARIVQ